MRTPWIVGVSGASGTPYAAAVLRGLLDAGCAVDLVVSRAARLTILDETGRPFRDAHWRDHLAPWLGGSRGAAGAAFSAFPAPPSRAPLAFPPAPPPPLLRAPPP